MAASHFFVGLGAGVALLTLPVLVLAPGIDVPGKVAGWVNGPQPSAQQATANAPALTRPVRGFVAGEPTPAQDSPPPTLVGLTKPTAQPPQAQPTPTLAALPASGTRTGVIRSPGAPVTVRRAAGVDSPNDPTLADGAPVLVSYGSDLNIGGQGWRAVRGLNGIVGWVPSAYVRIDGEAPVGAPSVATPLPSAERLKIANTGGVGVALRGSPNDADRLRVGLADGAGVTVLERQGADWVRVRGDGGQEGWVPARYLTP